MYVLCVFTDFHFCKIQYMELALIVQIYMYVHLIDNRQAIYSNT